MRSAFRGVVSITIFFQSYVATGQSSAPASDTSLYEIEYDTIITVKDPLIIQKQVVQNIYTKPKSRLFLEPYVMGFYNQNLYTSCPMCEEYTTRLKASTHYKIQLGAGVALYATFSKFIVGVNLSALFVRENFFRTTIGGTTFQATNKFDYLDYNLEAGYVIRLSKHVQLVPKIGFGLNNLLHYSGLTLDVATKDSVASLRETTKFYPSNFTGFADLQVRYLLTTRKYVFVSTYYTQNIINSITKCHQPYQEQRRIMGVKIGIGFGF